MNDSTALAQRSAAARTAKGTDTMCATCWSPIQRLVGQHLGHSGTLRGWMNESAKAVPHADDGTAVAQRSAAGKDAGMPPTETSVRNRPVGGKDNLVVTRASPALHQTRPSRSRPASGAAPPRPRRR